MNNFSKNKIQTQKTFYYTNSFFSSKINVSSFPKRLQEFLVTYVIRCKFHSQKKGKFIIIKWRTFIAYKNEWWNESMPSHVQSTYNHQLRFHKPLQKKI